MEKNRYLANSVVSLYSLSLTDWLIDWSFFLTFISLVSLRIKASCLEFILIQHNRRYPLLLLWLSLVYRSPQSIWSLVLEDHHQPWWSSSLKMIKTHQLDGMISLWHQQPNDIISNILIKSISLVHHIRCFRQRLSNVDQQKFSIWTRVETKIHHEFCSMLAMLRSNQTKSKNFDW